MLKPSQLKKPQSRVAERFEFTDSGQDAPWVMWLRRLSPLEMKLSEDIQRELYARYVTGGWVNEHKQFIELPDVILGPDGKPIIVSHAALEIAVRLDLMQDAPAGEDEYSASQIIELIPYYEEAWSKIQIKYWELLNGPKATSGTTEPSSSPASTVE